MHFDIVQGDIAKQSAHVLVNTTSPSLTMDCGVAASLRRGANGPLKADVTRTTDESRNSVVVTDAYELDAQYVIHAIPFTENEDVTKKSISAATRDILTCTDELGCRSLVIPALGCGGGKFDLSEGIQYICEEIWNFTPTSVADVRVIVHTQSDFEQMSDIARAIKQSDALLERP